MEQNESSDTAILDLKDQLETVKRQSFSLLLALIVVSGTVTVYIYQQASLQGKELGALQQPASQVINAFNQNRAIMQNFVTQLNAYGQTHPDIEQLLIRNNFAAPSTKH